MDKKLTGRNRCCFSYKDTNFKANHNGHPSIQKELEKQVSKALEAIKQQIYTHEDSSWLESARKNDAMVAALTSSFGPKLPDELLKRWTDKNLSALAAFKEREQAGMNLSKRVWNMKDQMMEEMGMCIELGIGEGKSAASLSRDIRKYLNEPTKLFRRVRDKFGILRLSKAASAYHPGRGVYRSSYKNAIRLAGTEINMAYRTADHHRWQQLDFVTGIRIKISHNSHPCEDICDTLQGVYPKDILWTGWHPQCHCAAFPEVPNEDVFTEYLQREYDGEDMSRHTFQGVVTDVPENFKEWVIENEERISRAASVPYFIRDNIKYTPSKWKDGVAEAIDKLDYNLMPELNSIKFSVKNLTSVSNQEVIDMIKEVDKANPGLFKGGLKEVKIVDADKGFMANERVSGTNTLYISNRTFEMPGGKEFNPLNELKGAMANIVKNKKKAVLTFDQEYALESLWHEIRHASAFGWRDVANKAEDLKNSMELINQFCARKSYRRFVQSLGGNVVHEKKIMEKGYGYNRSVQNFCILLKKMKVSQKSAYKHFKDIIVDKPYEDIHDDLIRFISESGKYEVGDASAIVKSMDILRSEFVLLIQLRMSKNSP